MSTIPPPLSRLARLRINLFTLGALIMSAVLMWHEGQEHAALPGCSADDACNAVVTGRWALIAGIPVATVGIGGYAGLFVLSLLTRIERLAPVRTLLWSAMAGASLIGLGFIAWLIFLQGAVIGHFCMWCLTAHAFGSVAFLCVLFCVPVWRSFPWAGMRIGGFSAATLSTMIALHIFIVPDLTVAEEAGSFDASVAAQASESGTSGIQFGKKPKTSRTVEFMEGNLNLDIFTLPVLGDRDADHVIIELFDYTCPSCRKVYWKVKEFKELHHGAIAVVTLAVPMEADCNPHLDSTHSLFRGACEYAQTGLAVYKADPQQFQPFHEWLMDGAKVPSVKAAREKAIELVGEDALDQALADPAIAAWIQDGINIHRFIQADTLPKIIAGNQIISSSGLARRKLFIALSDALDLPTPE